MKQLVYFLIFYLFLVGTNSYAQLSPTGKTDPIIEGKVLGTDTLKLPADGALVPGRDFVIFANTEKILFQQPRPGIPNANHGILIATAKKNSMVGVACNGLSADYPGRIYVCWDDEKFSAGNSDVFLAYSSDSGATWTEPILVTYRPNHKTQFMPQMMTDQKGVLYILYYDGQNSADNKLTDVYLAISRNGGLKFEYYRVNTKAFKFSDYKVTTLLHSEPPIVVWNEKGNRAHAVEIRDSVLAAYNARKAGEEIGMERTFTFADTIKVNFTLRETSRVSAIITRPLEPGFEKWVVKNKKFKKGSHALTIDTKAAGLKKGNYTVTLYYNGNNSYAWIMEE